MPTTLPPDAPSRDLTADQRHLARWLSALLVSGRGPRKVTALRRALADAGVPDPSYETIVKAARGAVALPARYVAPLADIYGLVGDERAAFALAGLLAHASPEVADAFRRAHDLPEVAPIPDLGLTAAAERVSR